MGESHNGSQGFGEESLPGVRLPSGYLANVRLGLPLQHQIILRPFPGAQWEHRASNLNSLTQEVDFKKFEIPPFPGNVGL